MERGGHRESNCAICARTLNVVLDAPIQHVRCAQIPMDRPARIVLV